MSLRHARTSRAKVESLCSSSLAEVGVAVEDFIEALEASRLSQDISTAVYEQLVALDDFVTFKKLMVRVLTHEIRHTTVRYLRGSHTFNPRSS